MVPGVPSPSAKKEYLSAVKVYEQQLGPTILRGKMYIENLPAEALPPEQRFSAQTVAPGMVPGMAPGMECRYNMAMGVGPGQPCGYGRGMPMSGGYDESGRPMGVGYDAGRTMGGGYGAGRPLGGGYGQPMEGPTVPSSTGYAGLPMLRRGSIERPVNAPGGFGRQPMSGYDSPMRLPPGYGGPTDRDAGPLDRYDVPQDCYDHPPDRHDGPPDRYDGPPPNTRSYGRRAFPGENSRSVWEDELPGRAVSKQRSQTTASDLLRKIRDDIEEHCADSMSQKIHGEVAGYGTDETDERRVRRGSLPENRTTFPRSFRDDDGESRRAVRTSSSTRRFRDDHDVPRRSPSPRRQPSRRRQESSCSTSSSSDGKSRHSRTSRRRKDTSTKSLKSRSERRSKSKTKRSSSSSSASSRGRRRGKGKSSKKESSSSSSSSSSDVRRQKKKSHGGECKRSVTVRLSREAQKDLQNISKHCETLAKSLSSTQGGNGCPFLNILRIQSHEQESLNRPPSRNVVDALPMCGVERNESQNFRNEVTACNSVSRPSSKNFVREV